MTTKNDTPAHLDSLTLPDQQATAGSSVPSAPRKHVVMGAGALSFIAMAAALGAPISNHQPVGHDYANRVPVQKMPRHQGTREIARRQRHIAKAEGQ